MTQEEFRKTTARMFKSLADPTFVLDKKPCKGVHCIICPIHTKLGVTSDECMIDNLSISDAFDIIEVVEKWAKEHPFITNEQKYKEVFGVEPKNERGEYVCPAWAGFDICNKDAICSKGCNENFWTSEYKEPKKEASDADTRK